MKSLLRMDGWMLVDDVEYTGGSPIVVEG